MTKIRERNPRGQGAKLRDDILAAATALLEESGNEESVTLRAIARKAGITAPSIYAHFEDRESILESVIALAFDELVAVISSATQGIEDPVKSLHAGCHAYLAFAAERPHRYRVLFERQRDFAAALSHERIHALETHHDTIEPKSGAEAFDLLVDGIQRCIDAGRSGSVDAFADAAALWSAMHGFATLHRGLSDFPWPDPRALEETIIDQLARIRVG